MSEIGFYHLLTTPLERALPKLLEKVLESGRRAVVISGSDERVEGLNGILWTYDQGGFLPHGSARDGHAAHQPVWLTDADENPNGATVLVLTDGAESENVAGFERCLELFDGRDESAVAAARARWKAYEAAGHDLKYWQQTALGGWEAKGA